MINLGITLFVTALCFYYGILYENVTILVCGMALGILLLLSVVEALYRLFTIECRLEIPISVAEQNRPVNIGIRVDNTGVIPGGKVKFCISVHNALMTKGKKQWFSIRNAYAEGLRYDFPIAISKAGCLEVELTKMRVYSLTGLVYVTKRYKQSDFITVMPEIHSMAVRVSEAVRNFMGDADVYDDVHPGYDPSETFEIRPYRQKDKLQSIHWKLSAKTEELMVRENSLPIACAVVVLLDIRDAFFDGFLELAASVSFALLDNRVPHFMAWYSKEKGEIARCRIDDEESFYVFLSVFLRDGMIVKDFQIEEAYKEKYRGERYLHKLVITKDLEIYKNGERVVQIDKNKMAHECEKLEILL